MSIRTRIDTDIIYQDGDSTTLTVGSLTEHLAAQATVAQITSGTVGTSAVTIVGTPPLSTLALKNTGTGVLRVAGAIDVSAGRLAVLPVTATVTVQTLGGPGSYSCIWVG